MQDWYRFCSDPPFKKKNCIYGQCNQNMNVNIYLHTVESFVQHFLLNVQINNHEFSHNKGFPANTLRK